MSEQISYSIYLHIPFCRHRCSYCDFNTYTTVNDLQDEYIAALANEIRQVGSGERRLAHTIYLGGGTPSLITSDRLKRLFQAVNETFRLARDAEITLEANPDTVNLEYLIALRQLGVNRLSFGAQSADEDELALLEREHDFATVIQAVEMSRTAGFDNINLDLIYGLPGQSRLSWERTLRKTLELKPPHLSLYCLTIEPGTPMRRWLLSGQIHKPDPDLAADQFELACDLLYGEGFEHYEISNWSIPGQECQHNLSYWRNQQYLGLGAGAHGHAAGYRYWVVRQPRTYIRRMIGAQEARFPWSSALAGKNKLNRQEAMSDVMITQLRLLQEGVDVLAFEDKFGLRPDEAYPEEIRQLNEYGLINTKDHQLLLSKKGWFLSNQVFYRFM